MGHQGRVVQAHFLPFPTSWGPKISTSPQALNHTPPPHVAAPLFHQVVLAGHQGSSLSSCLPGLGPQWL